MVFLQCDAFCQCPPGPKSLQKRNAYMISCKIPLHGDHTTVFTKQPIVIQAAPVGYISYIPQHVAVFSKQHLAVSTRVFGLSKMYYPLVPISTAP